MQARLSALGQQLLNLRLLYLPDDSREGALEFSHEETEKAKAFLVFCHAELEAFFEKFAEDKVDAAYAKWKKRQPSRVISNLLISYAFDHNDINCTSKPKKFNNDKTPKSHHNQIKEMTKNIIDKYKLRVSKNHGIRETNLRFLFGSIGLNLSNLDNDLISDLNSFAVERGERVHTSGRTQRPLNPFDEFDRVKRIFLALKKFTNQVNSL